MPIQNIKLEQGEWEFDTDFHLGPPGGFGEVFKGKGGCGEVAIKRLKIDAGAAAHREMKIGSELVNRTHDHVVPIIDSGQDANGDRYYLVMPICERSLKDEVESKGVLTWDEGRVVALNIISGLLEVADIVHRDLKPDNVLFHNGRWCIEPPRYCRRLFGLS